MNVHSIGDEVIGDSVGTFNYQERNAVPQATATLAATIDGRTTQVTRVTVNEDTTLEPNLFPTTFSSISFSDGEIFNYDSIDTTGEVGTHTFVSGTPQSLVQHSSGDTVSSTVITYTFVATTSGSQDIGTHSTTVATTVIGNDHTFSGAGGAAGGNGFTNAAGDGEVGDVFDARVQTGDFNPPEGNFRGDGGTAGDFDGDKNGGIGGRGEGF